jgi:hypothetical protein
MTLAVARTFLFVSTPLIFQDLDTYIVCNTYVSVVWPKDVEKGMHGTRKSKQHLIR